MVEITLPDNFSIIPAPTKIWIMFYAKIVIFLLDWSIMAFPSCFILNITMNACFQWYVSVDYH